ncbi:hypothetical protein AAVH_06795 [Aphelenchoides avenae]|nr:hypothetical protein AAVH_06795 [Aphelenchus avenae]
MDYCANPQCDVDNNNPARCRVKERLTMAKPVGGLPRWQFIKCNVEVPNPYEPYDHDDNRANFDALKVTPHATLDLHGFYESTPAGPPTWNTDHRKSYKLRGYVLLSSRTYGHLAWRTSFTVGNTTLYLHCHGKNVYFISEEEYSKSDQKILLLVYETDSQPPSPTASTSSGGTSDPSQRNPKVGPRGCWI